MNGSDKASTLRVSDDNAGAEGNVLDESQGATAVFDIDEAAKAYVCELERQINAKNRELEQAAQYARCVESAFVTSAHGVRRLEAALTASFARQDALGAQLAAIKQSKSWRTTEPLRVLIDRCRRFVRSSRWAHPPKQAAELDKTARLRAKRLANEAEKQSK